MNPFRTTLFVLIVLMVATAVGVIAVVGWRGRERARLSDLGRQRAAAETACAAEDRRTADLNVAHPPILRFLNAWRPHLAKPVPERSVGGAMRAALEELAQRKLGLITDQVTTPEPVSVVVAGRPVRVQRVALRASGESLNALLTWLGEAEALYPYARVETCDLMAESGRTVSMRLGLAQPVAVRESEGRRQ
ncbi:hypothetical protein GALL_84700 [mine drainage metagenome]|uniref:Uncharacterized protein n=1 Tax=mine drainage metagenome TaxID=410659 RepID=A0A1J5SYX5_9ZZZZ